MITESPADRSPAGMGDDDVVGDGVVAGGQS
jgi:hypothetical protein